MANEVGYQVYMFITHKGEKSMVDIKKTFYSNTDAYEIADTFLEKIKTMFKNVKHGGMVGTTEVKYMPIPDYNILSAIRGTIPKGEFSIEIWYSGDQRPYSIPIARRYEDDLTLDEQKLAFEKRKEEDAKKGVTRLKLDFSNVRKKTFVEDVKKTFMNNCELRKMFDFKLVNWKQCIREAGNDLNQLLSLVLKQATEIK